MRRLLNWAREIQWLGVLAILVLIVAITLGVVSIWLPSVTGLALILAFGSLTLAFLTD